MVNTQHISSPNRTASLVEISGEEMSRRLIMDGIHVSLSVLNHCEGRVQDPSIVFDNNVPPYVIMAVLVRLGLKVWKMNQENLNMAQ